MASARRQPVPRISLAPAQQQQQQPSEDSFLQIREAIDNQSPMNSVPVTPTSPRSARAGTAGRQDEPRLSVIAEDGDVYVPGSRPAPPVPPKSTHRPFARRWRDAPPRASLERQPPAYSSFETEKQRRDRLAEFINQPVVARRGGWRRLLVFIVLGIVILGIGLGVGLGVGLTRNRNNSSQPDGGSSSSGTADQGFPAGQYAIYTNLDRANTSCTANPSTFRCFPYSTYSQSTSASSASFNWIIVNSGSNYLISSSDNPFSITFSNVSLTLVDAGAPSERYTFSMSMNKLVLPSTVITTDNQQAQCYYNGTILSAALYTKMNGTQSSTSTNSASSWKAWPFAAEINQTISGGDGVPACYETVNGQLGARVTNGLAPQGANTQCGCFYRNYNL